MAIIEKIAAIGLKPSQWLGSAITAGIEKITGKKYGRTTSEELAKTKAGKVLGTATLGASAALAAAIAGSGSLIKGVQIIAKKVLIPSGTPSQVAKGIVARTALAGIVASGGTEALIGGAQKVIKGTFEAGKSAGEVISGEKTQKEGISDVLKTSGALLGVGALGTAAGYVAEKIPEAVSGIKEKFSGDVETPMTEVGTAIGGTATEPQGTPYKEIDTTKKRYKRSKKTISPTIRNNIRIINLNRNTGISKRYLNKNYLYN